MNRILSMSPILAVCLLACGSTGGTDGGTPTDGGTDAGRPVDAGPMTVDAGPKLNCAGIANCASSCTTTTCGEACLEAGTTTGKSLFEAAETCISNACPSATGDACADQSSSTCTMCVTTAQQAGGTCVSQVDACESDTSTDSTDGGTGTGTSCDQMLICINACTTQACANACYNAGSTSAQQTYLALDMCWMTACPTTASGTCATQTSTTCQTCLQTAATGTGTCASDYNSCSSN